MNEKLLEATLQEHITELKVRLIKCIVLFLIACCVGFYFANEIYNFLATPLVKAMKSESRKLIFTGITEGFMTHMRVSIFFGLSITFPYIVLQVYRFLAPGLYRNERKVILPFVLISVLLFFLGICMAYFFVAPIACKFFITFEGTIQYDSHNIPVVLEARISEYLSTIIQLIVCFGIVFQLPIIILVLCKLGILSIATLKKYRRHAIVMNFIIAAILTPPDVISQIMLALPMVLLYEIAILIVRRCL